MFDTQTQTIIGLIPKYAVVSIVVFVFYFLYRSYFNEKQYVVKGNISIKGKRIGRPPPAYPNGWYIVSKSTDLKPQQTKAVDIAGQNLVLFRSSKGVPYILEAYCKHMGANLGIQSKVINDKCIQCPFHGWLYDGQTGISVDYNGNPIPGKSIEYNEQFCHKGGKLEWKQQEEQKVKLRKYPCYEGNGYIYVWIHAMKEHQQIPIYPVINVQSFTKNLVYRSRTVHTVRAHIQDIPENGSDIYHFKFVHTYPFQFFKHIFFNWKAKWRRGDDPDVKEIFEHNNKRVREFKQRIYHQLIQNFPEKRFISIGYIDNYTKLPFMEQKYMFNVTILQLGAGIVYIFLCFPTHVIVFFHYIQPKERYKQIVYHDLWTNNYVPYWISAISAKFEGDQVTNDMLVWDSKKFARKMYYKQGQVADDFIRKWRLWYSQNYEGTVEKEKQDLKLSTEW